MVCGILVICGDGWGFDGGFTNVSELGRLLKVVMASMAVLDRDGALACRGRGEGLEAGRP